MCDFSDLLQQYANTMPNKHLMFRVSKKCGYSQLVMLQRIPNSNQVTVSDLLLTIQQDMGDYTVGKIYYYPKTTVTTSATPTQTYLTHQTAMQESLDQFALNHIPTAYSIDECKYAVYQLYVDTDCCNAGRCCTREQYPPPLFLPPPMIADDPSNQYSFAMSIDDEPTREELLSLFYTAPESPSLSSSRPPFPPQSSDP